MQAFVRLEHQIQMNRNDFKLGTDEELHDLQTHGLFLIQKRKGYCFTQDAVLLANFVKTKKSDIVCDFCGGAGIVSILVQAKKNPQKIFCIEIQDVLSTLAKRSVEFNKLENKIEVINDSIQNWNKHFKSESFDIVMSNPPFFKKENPSCATNEKSIARQEILVDFEAIAKTANKLLKFGGKLFLVHQTTRLSEILNTLSKYDLEPKTLQLVHPNQRKESNIFLVEATKGGKTGLKVLPTLFVFDEQGNETEEIKKIYCRKN